MLARLAALISQLSAVKGVHDRVKILAGYADLKDILKMIYSDQSFGITSHSVKSCHTEQSVCEQGFNNLNEFVGELCQGNLKKSAKAIESVSAYIASNQQYAPLIHKIIDKNLKVGIGRGLLQMAFGDLSKLPIALAVQLENGQLVEHLNREMQQGSRFLYSRKIDGVRCITKITSDRQVTFHSRSRKSFPNAFKKSLLPSIDPYLRLPMELAGETVYLDGELAVVDQEHHESFTKTVSAVYNQKQTGQSVRYFLFDCLTESEMYGLTKTGLSDRLARVTGIHDPVDDKCQVLSQVPISRPVDKQVDYSVNQLIVPKQWEGVIIRKDCPFRGRRSSDLIKLKMFKDDEFTVRSFQLTEMLIDGADQSVLKSVQIEHKGNLVSVGSGFSLSERILFANNPSLIVGKQITVKYFEESVDGQGRFSLRFPVFKCVKS